MSAESKPLMDSNSIDQISPESSPLSTNESDALSLQAVISNHSELEPSFNNDEETPNQIDPILSQYHTACQSGDLATIKKLIESHLINIESDFDPVERVTGLHWAAINNKLSVVKYLLKQGADPNFKSNSLNATPLHWAARYGYVYIVDYLLNNSDADATICDDQGFNVLHLAVNSSNIMLVCYVLYFIVDTGLLDIDCKDLQGRTSLLWASYQGDPLTVSQLLKFGANVKLTDNTGFTALHWGVVKGQSQVLKHLIKDGQADFFNKTGDGKNCFDIANELKTMSSLRDALTYSGFDHNGYRIKRYLKNEHHARLITFITPLLMMVPLFITFAHWNTLFVVLFGACYGVIIRYTLLKFVLPSLISGNKSIYKVSLSKTPIVAGIFFGSLVIVSVLWFWKMFSVVFWEEKVLSLVVSGLFILVYVLFIQLLESNPGIIEPQTNHDNVRTTITDLLSLGQFDTKNFCIETQIRKPIRSKFSTFQQRVITRFDHFCPWINNDVGLMNHKKFVWFISGVEMTIFIFMKLCFEYFDAMKDMLEDHDNHKDIQCFLLGDDELCYGYTKEPVIFLALGWSGLQLIWVTMLLIIQWVQIVEGVTNYEFTLLSKKKHRNHNFNEYFNSAPDELLPDGGDGYGDELDDDINSQEDFITNTEDSNETIEGNNNGGLNNKKRKNIFQMGLCCKMIGVEPWIRLFKDRHKFHGSLNSLYGTQSQYKRPTTDIPIQIGYLMNIKDFWLASDYKAPLWTRLIESPRDNKALLNGYEVDYSKLYDLSQVQRSSSELV